MKLLSPKRCDHSGFQVLKFALQNLSLLSNRKLKKNPDEILLGASDLYNDENRG